MIPVININDQKNLLQDEILKRINEVVINGNFILGPEVKKFESDIEKYLGVKHAIGVANGTDALVIALDALGIGPEDEVITTPFTFFATAEAICRVGATPVFVDVDLHTYNMDVKKIIDKITPKTKAIMPVHIFGNPVDFDSIKCIADEYNLSIVEDACQAIGAYYKNKKIGSLGNAACFSFFPTKNLGGFGDGGLITTNDDVLAEKIKMMRFHGQKVKYQNEMMGYNSRLDEIQAAILNVKCPYLDTWNAQRRKIASHYTDALSKVKGIKCPEECEEGQSVYHLYTIQVERRTEFVEYLESKGIGVGIYYHIPLHLQNALKFLGYTKGDFPNAEYLSEHVVSLPMYAELTDEQQDYIIDAIKEYGAQYGK